MLRFNLIVAVCENFGIGIKGDLPWRLKSELKYFSHTTKKTNDPAKHNAVVMGRKTYFGVPESKRPLPDRLNIVLSTTLKPEELPESVLLFPNLEEALKFLEGKEEVENTWIVGGSGVYAEAMASPKCHRLYITKIQQEFECDTFFPAIPDSFQEVTPESDVPLGVQEENGIKYEYKVLEKQSQ
ncbi:dihydrofolate reductase [Drosophila ficusphila]|uniref:dihydrofolate reductase n=1 Tax=Drosophila ficusphila TaxID=30025 RepID=UPI0007E74E66|nr:dihydrofolate reductase [Drosophila ficusphila]